MDNKKFNFKLCVLLPIVLIITVFLLAVPTSFFGIAALTATQQAQARENIGAVGRTEITEECAFRIVLENETYYLEWYGNTDSCPYSIVQDGTDYVLQFDYTY